MGGQIASGAIIEYVNGSLLIKWHPVLGVVTYFVCALTVVLGYISAMYFQIRIGRDIFIRHQLLIRQLHKTFGYFVFAVSVVVSTWGCYDMAIGDPLATTLFAILAVSIPTGLFYLGERDRKVLLKELIRRKSSFATESRDGAQTNTAFPTLKKQLPKMTWDDVNNAVLEGEQLIVIDDIIYHIESFLSVHPGGTRGLKAYIGQDASRVFAGAEPMSAAPSEKPQADLHLPSIVHAHSRVARYQLQSMEYGRLVERRSRSMSSAGANGTLRRTSTAGSRNASIVVDPARPSTLDRSIGKLRENSATNGKLLTPGDVNPPPLVLKSSLTDTLKVPLKDPEQFTPCEVAVKETANSALADR
ncbi:hypothetical protein HDU93_005068, partial [Gonapodya sp. JEL0774]